ncbi:hypothetical protein [Microbispora sp. GKU 823]|uniref:hypothetical protein n=1 Tax=Microbispora sp. GKU 823 TaxID=1652100 RepID=UPI0009A27DD9|nr:hypothetical protein [Microbispora sp. GKU 823]OPG13645.1 hypothetical protein B1L11_06570 [Microbispora sp. GKU 823]
MNAPTKTILTIVVTAALSGAATIGILLTAGLLDTDRTPAPIAEACRTFITAYDDAAREAKRQNDNTLQTELAHPWRVADVWKARHQAALEAAALKVQNLSGDWGNVAWRIVEAATAMNPRNLDTGAVDQENALSAAQAACIGR